MYSIYMSPGTHVSQETYTWMARANKFFFFLTACLGERTRSSTSFYLPCSSQPDVLKNSRAYRDTVSTADGNRIGRMRKGILRVQVLRKRCKKMLGRCCRWNISTAEISTAYPHFLLSAVTRSAIGPNLRLQNTTAIDPLPAKCQCKAPKVRGKYTYTVCPTQTSH